MNTIESPALRLSVVVPESAAWHHHPVYTEIVHRAHAAGLAGATVIRGIEGFGASRHIHTMRILSLAEDIPVLVLIIDEETKIRAFLPELDELVSRGVVVLDGVEVVRYVGEPGAPE